MDGLHAILGALLLGIFAFLFGKKVKKEKKELVPPKSGAASVAREDIQETFEEEITRVEKARKGDDPTTALADLGNSRRRH